MKYITKNKLAVINCLRENQNKHMTIEEIERELNGQVPLASLYRIVDSLVLEGVVRKYITDVNQSACYQFISDNANHNHFHLLCSGCGKLIHLECDEVNHLLDHIKDEHGFAVDISKINLYGLCKDCQARNNK